MKPLEIKIHIATPVAAPFMKKSFPLHLDALLISVLTNKQKRVYPIAPNENFDDPFSPEKKALPLAVADVSKPIYCASVAFAAENISDIYTYIRRPPEIEVWGQSTHKEFRQGGEKTGKKKGVLTTLSVYQPQTLLFECIGDKLELHDILQNVKYIGHKRNVGFGQIYGIEINETDNKYAGLITKDGQPARALPIEDWKNEDDWVKLTMAYKAPYWEASNISMCWCPEFKKTYPRVG